MARSARNDFNIRIDGDNPDSLLNKNLKELRIDQLNRKINLLFLIILILIGILSAAAYFEIKGRTSAKEAAKTAIIEKTLTEMASQYSALSDKIVQMEKSVAGRLTALEKNNAGLKSALALANKHLDLLSSSKIGKHELKQIYTKIDTSIAPFQEQIQIASSQIRQLDKNIKQELFLLADALDKYKMKHADLSQTVAKESGHLTGLTQTAAVNQKKIGEIQKTIQQQQGNLNRLVKIFEDEKGEWDKLSRLIIQNSNQPIELPDKIKRSVKAVDQLQAELLTMAKSVVYQKTLDSALIRNQKKNQQHLDRLERNLRTKITALQKKFLKFEKKMSSAVILPQSGSARPAKRRQTPARNSSTIFEQDIK